MPLLVNLRHLETRDLHLKDELAVRELDIDPRDEMIRLAGPVHYDLEVQKLEGGLLVHGSLRLTLECQCVRCLKPFRQELTLDRWTGHVPLEGEEAARVSHDCVDLTPYLREDILLEFPQHPLCDTECRGLPKAFTGGASNSSSTGQLKSGSSAWDELNKLKF